MQGDWNLQVAAKDDTDEEDMCTLCQSSPGIANCNKLEPFHKLNAPLTIIIYQFYLDIF